MKRERIFIVLLLVIFVYSGCAKSRYIQKSSLNMISPALQDLINGVLTLKSGHLARDGIAGLCMLITALTEMTPENYDFLVTAALAYTANAMLVEDDDPEYASRLYSIAMEYGIRALRTNKSFKKAYEKGGINATKEVIDNMDKDYVPALIWTALPWGMWMIVNMTDDAMALQHLNFVKHMVTRANKLEDTYFYGISHLFLMFYAAMMPPMMGGTVERVEEEYKEVMRISNGNFLLACFYYAREYAAQYMNKELFEEKLNIVLKTPSDRDPGMALLNEIAKIKARRLIKRGDELFY